MTRRINYAPGAYVCFCVDCDAEFMGHPYAVRCEQCAARDSGSGPTGRRREPAPGPKALARGPRKGMRPTFGAPIMTRNELTEELKPCPFCGGQARAWEAGAGKLCPAVWCQNTVSCGGEVSISDESVDAITAWNTRAHSIPAPEGEVGELVERLRREAPITLQIAQNIHAMRKELDSQFSEPMPTALSTERAMIEAADTILSLTKARDDYSAFYAVRCGQLAEAETRIALLEEALEPFAREAKRLPSASAESDRYSFAGTGLSYGDLRRARAARKGDA